MVDWEHNGARIKATPSPRVQNEQYYFKEGWTYTTTARVSIGLRWIHGASIFAHKSSAVILKNQGDNIGNIMNCRAASYLVRGIRAQIDLSEDYVARIAIPVNSLDISSNLDETGTPAGWYPLIHGYEAIPSLPDNLQRLPYEVVAVLAGCER